MKRLVTTLLCCFLLGAVFAQDLDSNQENPVDESPTEIDGDYVYSSNQEGDLMFKINVSGSLPIDPSQLNFGLDLSLGISRFFSSKFILGVDATFSYNGTIADNFFYSIPVMARATYQFSFGSFELPISLGIGGAFEMYAERFYFGLAVEPEIGVYYRIDQEWSVGVTGACAWYPQWYKNSANDDQAFIATAGISFRYFF